ncbi:MAG TPA: hypothetical protein VEZ91_11915 [Kurthia gibsonii]|nr:hypothetical protein [Kurthia gibsonii]
MDIFLYNMSYKFVTKHTIVINCDSNIATNVELVYTGADLQFSYATPKSLESLRKKLVAAIGHGPFTTEKQSAIKKIERID